EDDDASEDIDPTQFYEFNVYVTEAIANTKQVFHFPNKTSKYVLVDKHDKILLRDEDTRRLWHCTMKTSNRYKYERYLGDGWYDFKDDKRLRAGDVPRCTIEDPPTHMNVKVVRGSSRRR
ncbi:hypothetical protein A2U01_0041799, partial [Trifolium medium]|nr:hypothetical protein [Trifolium medium]